MSALYKMNEVTILLNEVTWTHAQGGCIGEDPHRRLDRWHGERHVQFHMDYTGEILEVLSIPVLLIRGRSYAFTFTRTRAKAAQGERSKRRRVMGKEEKEKATLPARLGCHVAR